MMDARTMAQYTLCRNKDLRQIFHCGDTIITQCRKIIKDHPERYTYYGTSGKLTNTAAFMDALTFRTRIQNGEPVPPFDPEGAAKMVGTMIAANMEADG